MSRPTPTPILTTPTPGSRAAGSEFFSSGSITFAAFMDMLKAQQTMMNDMAKLAVSTAQERGNLVNSQVAATVKTYNDDASQLDFQRDEQYTQGAIGCVQGGVAIAATRGTGDVSEHASNMSDLVKESNTIAAPKSLVTLDGRPLPGSHLSVAPPRPEYSTAQKDTIEEITRKIQTKSFDYKEELFTKDSSGKVGMERDLGNGITMKEVLENAKFNDADTLTNSGIKGTELDVLRKRIGSARQQANRDINTKQQDIQNKTQLANSFTQMLGGIAGAQWKEGEAGAMTNKGADSAAQQIAQSCGQFAKEASDSQTQATEQANRASQQVWQSVHEVVQVGIRG